MKVRRIACYFLPIRAGRPLKHTGAFAAKGEGWETYSEYIYY